MRRRALASGVVTDDDLPELPPKLHALRAHVLEHSVKRGEFTLKSGATSSWFLDTKQTACLPDGIIAVTDAVYEVFADVLGQIACHMPNCAFMRASRLAGSALMPGRPS